MNIHKNARLTLIGRREMVTALTLRQLSLAAAADQFGVSTAAARKWPGRFLAEGEAGLADRSSCPHISPRAISPATALPVAELRKKRTTQARIAHYLGLSEATVSRIPSRAGLSRLSDLAPGEPVVRHEHAHPGDLIHLDTRKLARIERSGHRARCDSDGQRLGIPIQDLCGGGAGAWAESALYPALPPANQWQVRAVVRSALREWAYGFVYRHSSERSAKLAHWQLHYNRHRPHQGIGGLSPMSKFITAGNNLLHLHI